MKMAIADDAGSCTFEHTDDSVGSPYSIGEVLEPEPDLFRHEMAYEKLDLNV